MVMPMGLCNAPATFQTLMNSIFHDVIDDFLVVYLDDLLVFSNTEKEHLEHLNIILSRLRKNKLYAAISKCEFFKEELEFLGLHVGRGTI